MQREHDTLAESAHADRPRILSLTIYDVARRRATGSSLGKRPQPRKHTERYGSMGTRLHALPAPAALLRTVETDVPVDTWPLHAEHSLPAGFDTIPAGLAQLRVGHDVRGSVPRQSRLVAHSYPATHRGEILGLTHQAAPATMRRAARYLRTIRRTPCHPYATTRTMETAV